MTSSPSNPFFSSSSTAARPVFEFQSKKMADAPDIAPIAAESQEESQCVESITIKLKGVEDYAANKPWKKWCIYPVPRRLKDVQKDKKTYVPQTISIGPHHLRSEQVQDMNFHKVVALHQMLKRTGQDLKLYLDSIKEVEGQVRACYKQEFKNLSSYEFVEMMVLDGCFILELLIFYPQEKGGNHVFSDERIVNDILLDMVILENQIPLFVIERLLKIYASGEHRNYQATALVLNLFNPEWLTGIPIKETRVKELISSLHQKNCLHILDVFRQSLLYGVYAGRQQGADRAPSTRHGQVIHRASDLKEGGVKFRKRDTNCFWDIKFRNGVLEIPTIWIHDSTKTIFLNVAAFEHCHLKMTDAIIASYVVFMECLVKSPEDVSHLHHCGIIQHLLGDDAEVVDMFKSISKEILVDPHDGYYAELSEQVNAYYNRRRNRWQARLIHKYLNNPWAVISLIAASILLVLTAIQSFYAVDSYYRPHS